MKKTEQPKKKLAFTTHTVRVLGQTDLSQVAGGKTTAITCTCPTTTPRTTDC